MSTLFVYAEQYAEPVMVAVILFWFQVKKRREEAVLYDVFPRHIADALVAGRKV